MYLRVFVQFADLWRSSVYSTWLKLILNLNMKYKDKIRQKQTNVQRTIRTTTCALPQSMNTISLQIHLSIFSHQYTHSASLTKQIISQMCAVERVQCSQKHRWKSSSSKCVITRSAEIDRECAGTQSTPKIPKIGNIPCGGIQNERTTHYLDTQVEHVWRPRRRRRCERCHEFIKRRPQTVKPSASPEKLYNNFAIRSGALPAHMVFTSVVNTVTVTVRLLATLRRSNAPSTIAK